MSDYGFRMSTFQVTGLTSRDVLSFSQMGDDIPGHFTQALREVSASGPERQDRTRQHNEILAVHSSADGRLVLCAVNGGPAGDAYRVTAPDGSVRTAVRPDDALTWVSRVLYYFPSRQGDTGFQVQETRGGTTHGTATNARIMDALAKHHGLRVSFRTDVIDGESRRQLLNATVLQLQRVEFEATGDSLGSFGEEDHVKKVAVSVSLAAGDEHSRRTVGLFFRPKSDGVTPADVGDTIGGIPGGDDLDFTQAKAIVTADGRSRTVRLEGGAGRFTMPIESPKQLTNHEFIRAVAVELLPLQKAMDIPGGSETLPLDDIPDALEA